MKEPKEEYTELYIDDFEPPEDWEVLRDEDGEVVPGCYRTKKATDSDNL